MDSSEDENFLFEDLESLHVGTPLLHSPNLSKQLEWYVKSPSDRVNVGDLIALIAQQRVSKDGEYTAVRLCQNEAVQTRGTNIQFVCGSGANAALAVSYCARQFGVEAIIVVPKATNERICEAIRTDGSHLILFGDDWTAADIHARKLVRRNSIYVPSSDHPHIWQGHSTIVQELKTQLHDNPPAAIICPVGGGGLLNGIIMGLQNAEWKDVPVIAVETHGSNAFQASVVAGKRVTVEKNNTIATSLVSKTVSAKSLELSLEHPVVPFAVSDAMAANAVRLFAEDNKMLVEVSAGAALSLCYTELIRDILPSLTTTNDVVVLVTGGSDISLEQVEEYRKKYANPAVLVKSGSAIFMKMDNTLHTMTDLDSENVPVNTA